ncbi:MAG: hypothetical protein Q9226_007382 [Calogaya cf. arnoldii]
MKDPSTSSRAWEGLTPPLAEWIIDAVDSMGFKRMTPVQASTIPLFMTHKSLLAFHASSAAALNPPDEATDMEAGAEPIPSSLKSEPKVVPQLLVGGDTSTAQDLTRFLHHSPNLLISTPGRLLELLSSPHVHCPQSSFEVLVLDEADRLLDLGFKEDLQKILSRLPKQRRTGLFSASVSEAVDQIVRIGLRNPVKIVVKVKGLNNAEDQRTPASLSLKYITCPASHKLPTLCKLLQSLDPTPNKTIIYLSTCAAVDYFQHILPPILPSTESGHQTFTLVPLHGKHPPKVRQKNFTAFSTSTLPSILLTTDVAARGLDIPQVDLVLQIDPPTDPKVFLHRCGRAGRAGRKGLSIIFLQPGREEEYVSFLEVRKTAVSPLELPSTPLLTTDQEVNETTSKIRRTVLTDRALHDKAQRAFVSWVKAYSKHQAGSIFRVTDLDWEDLGRAWGLLKLPKMPELKKWEGDRSLGLNDIDFKTYAYKDRKREQLRLSQVQEREAGVLTEGVRVKDNHDKGKKGGEKRAWSLKLEAKDERERRREKKRTKREAEKWEMMTPAEKEKQRELERMIESVKRKQMEEEQMGEFHGFDD